MDTTEAILLINKKGDDDTTYAILNHLSKKDSENIAKTKNR